MIHPGQLLQNRYQVRQNLGRGGFSRTYEVDDSGTLKVLKVLNLDRCRNLELEQKAVSLFQREAAVLSRLQHPGIPKVELDGYFTLAEAGQEAVHCLVMEKIDGLNLKQWLENQGNQPLTQEQAIAWLIQMSQILAQVHRQGLIHRDIKPSNIMLRANGQLVLIDFGAVREVTETYLQKQSMNEMGTLIFSVGYTPPEQMEGQAVMQSDFYALGRTFIYLLTGKHPNDFDKDSRTGRLHWRDSAPQVSKQLADLMDYLMATFPGKRPQTPQMIENCLAEIVSSASLPPPVIPSQESRRSPNQVIRNSNLIVTQKKSLLSFISSFLPTITPPSPWQQAELRRTLSGHSDVVRAVAVSPDGQILVSGSYDKTIKLWALRTGKLSHTLIGHTNRVTCIAISPDGETLASGSYDRTIKLWMLRTGELLQTLVGHSDRVRSVAFSPNGQTLISSGLEVQLWAVRTGKLLRTLIKHSDSARLATFSLDGQIYVIGSGNGTVELWSPHTGKQLRTFSCELGGMTSVAFSPDGQTLASCRGTFIELWNPHTGKQLRTFSSQSGGITSIAFSPDGQTLASCTGIADSATGKTIELWNPHTGKRLYALFGHSNSVQAVAFSPVGDFLVSGSYDQTVKIWQPVPADRVTTRVIR